MNNQAERIQNAINHIKSAVDIGPWAMEIAVEAMGKELPQPPKYVAKYYLFPHCPSCGREINTGDAYCLMCGQAIDWEVQKI